jgi:hypothetical protein
MGRSEVFRAHGIDALQALILALAGLSREITDRGRRDSALTWLGDRGLGLQVHCVFRVESQRMLDDMKRRGTKLPRDLRRRLTEEMRSLP